jgi:hypothetical protein
MSAPLQLDKGLLIENKGILLPWLTSADDLPNYGSPRDISESGRRSFYWDDCTCLGGLKCGLEAPFDRERNGLNGGGALQLVFVSLGYWPGVEVDEQFRQIYAMLKVSLGEPTEYYEDYAHHGVPLATWQFSGVEVVHMIFDRMGQYCAIDVKYKHP